MKSVKIKRLELNNYRQFVEQKIDFSVNDSKNVIIIEGKNGFGKSNIFNAINWCFFDVEEHLKPDERSLPICNTKQLNQAKPGKSIETSVKILLETEDGEKEIERKILTFKTGDGKWYRENSQLNVMQLVDKNWKAAPYPDYVISRILPRSMRHFFFIDGEKLRQLFENINPEQIKESIFNLSQITLLQNAIAHLDAFKDTFRRGIKDEPDLTWAEEAMERFKDGLTSSKGELKRLIGEIDSAFINKNKLDAEIDKMGDKNIQVLESDRKSAEESIRLLEASLNEKKDQYTKYLFKIAPGIVAKKSVDKTLKIIEKLETENELPPKIQATFLEELLRKNECICGINLNKKENYANREKLENLLKRTRYSDIVDNTLALKYALKGLLRENQDYTQKITDYEIKLKKNEVEIIEKQKVLKEINTKIGNTNVEQIKAMHVEREKYKQVIYEYKGRIGKAEQGIRTDEGKLRELEKGYNLLLSKKDKYKGIREKIAICDLSIQNIEKIKEKIMGEIRGETERYTKEYFNKLITAKSFENLEITEDYELSIKKDGYKAITSLSAAETLCMGYSFMAALRQTSGFVAPTIIDTPLAKIDVEYKLNVADWLKKALTNVQVILLVTDSEYTASFKKEISSVIGQELLLRHDEKTGTSEVTKHG